MPTRRQTIGLLAAAAMALSGFAGCGGGEDGPEVTKRELRSCLVDKKFRITAIPPGRPISTVSPAFGAQLGADGAVLRAVLVKNAERAERVAADSSANLLAIGAGDLAAELIHEANVVLIFESVPTPAERNAAASCVR